MAALIAMLTAVPATAQADAPVLTAEKFPAVATAGIDGYGQAVVMHLGGGEVYCEEGVATAELDGSSEVAIWPHLTACYTWMGIDPVSLPINTCHFGIALESGGPSYAAAAGFSCSNNKQAYVIQDPEGFCTVSVQSNTAQPQTAELTNVGSGTSRAVKIDMEMKGLKYTVTRHSIFCPLKAGTFQDGSMDWNTTLRSAASVPPNGIYVSNEL